jgi:signal peptidase I
VSKGKKKRRRLQPPEGTRAAPDGPGEDGRGKGSRGLVPRPRTKGGALIEIAVIVILALGLALAIQAWLVKPYQIPSESMEPTLDIGQRVLVNRLTYRFEDPGIGDIVVFHPPKGADVQPPECGVPHPPSQACPKPTPEESDQNFIKRIVAGPGDTLSVRDGHPVVNGVEKTDEPYINACTGGLGCDFPIPITIPPNHYFMMGDNRGRSDDSRFWGPVPREWIVGQALATYWPPDRVGLF